ncbi:hypothetical protein SAMN05421820_107162 [Pedobacter steynii]|uniref:Uncharacterized protein n=1 Tax=Pedobacter steynii TaxID=430522 RepID=A0A1H0APU5_9SPHI|nr:hypothetical protein SAMN05421820_107162 [Pedobacter steynii]
MSYFFFKFNEYKDKNLFRFILELTKRSGHSLPARRQIAISYSK